MLIPTVLEKSAGSEKAFDLWSRLLRDRTIFFTGQVEDHICSLAIAQLLFLESEDPDAPITMIVSSPGGSVTSGLGLISTMNFVSCPVHTIVTTQAASMGSLIASSGEKGHRYMLKHARHMIHQPLIGGLSGQQSEILLHAMELTRMREELTNIYVENTGQSYETLYNDTERDNVKSAKDSVDYGLADHVITTRAEMTKLLASK